ncbi:hypothetical protein P0092_14335 [Ruminiclostridium papyrosolvens DSM 2782]|uniref:hypothetical protein n=1 Tax=Ruminiclostridium papyrosolvens TaxID=29362 RepID=UPI0001B26ECC|nr:hypothetical protein [Ruminiclostridium papyrosolvens]WES32933.1 hypothetical protein P0092_14335 [Ruminiclostridium papyrosolvens DSM 2782]
MSVSVWDRWSRWVANSHLLAFKGWSLRWLLKPLKDADSYLLLFAAICSFSLAH